MCEKAGDHLPHRSGDEKWDLGFFSRCTGVETRGMEMEY